MTRRSWCCGMVEVAILDSEVSDGRWKKQIDEH